MKRLVLVLFLLLFPSYAYALACVSAGSGGWNVAGTWGACGGGVPGASDTVTINAGHVVTIDGNISVGNAPASATTYNIDISGTLYWPHTPGANWTFTARSSIRVNNGGVFQIADSGTPLNCANLARVLFNNTAANQKYWINVVAGGKLYAYGCPTYNSTTSIIRARIESCNPDCNAGAGRTLTLDRNVRWVASASATHDAIIVGIGGGTTPHGANTPEVISSWTAPATNQIGNVTLTQNHQPGDIIANASRNILFESDSAIYHSYISFGAGGGADNSFELSWIRLNEMGDTTSTAAAFSYNDPNRVYGKADYIAATNCEDGSSTACFYVHAASVTSFTNNIAHSFRSSGFGFNMAGAASTKYNFSNLTAIEDAATRGSGVSTGPIVGELSNIWVSYVDTGIIASTSSTLSITNGLIHGTASHGLDISSSSNTYLRFNLKKITDNEFRNIGSSGIYFSGGRHLIKNNSFRNVYGFCINLYSNGANASLINNTYDNCNYNNTATSGALYLPQISYNIFAMNERFGLTANNLRNNIVFDAIAYNTTQEYPSRFVCNNCRFTVPTNNLECVGDDLGTYGIVPKGCNTAPTHNAYIQMSDNTYVTIHNLNQVEGAHWGFGMGGMLIKRETATVVNNTLNVKIKPYNATDVAWLPLGTVQANAGQVITIKVHLRKNGAQADGERPKIALEGCGADRWTDFSEMTDVVNTWEEQTVTMVAAYKGTIHVYLGAKNTLSGADHYTPVSPPTLEVFADGISITKTGP